MIKIIHSSILCKWANLQNQQGIKLLLLPLYIWVQFWENSSRILIPIDIYCYIDIRFVHKHEAVLVLLNLEFEKYY